MGPVTSLMGLASVTRAGLVSPVISGRHPAIRSSQYSPVSLHFLFYKLTQMVDKKYFWKLKCLSITNLVTSVLMVLVGIVAIWVGYESLTHVFIETLDLKYVSYIIICTGSGFVLIGLIGFFASWYRRRLTISIFILVVLLLGLAAAGGGAFLIYFRNETDRVLQSESECIDSSEFEDAHKAVLRAEELIWTWECPCFT